MFQLTKHSRVLIRASLIAAACWLSLSRGKADGLWFDAQINGKPVHLGFDSALDTSVLFRPATERLGLHITNRPADSEVETGKIPMDRAESCELTLDGKKYPFSFGVIDLPPALRMDTDGFLSWTALDQGIFRLDVAQQKLATLDRLAGEPIRPCNHNIVSGVVRRERKFR